MTTATVTVVTQPPQPSDIKAWFRADIASVLLGASLPLNTFGNDSRFVDGYIAAIVALALAFGVVVQVEKHEAQA